MTGIHIAYKSYILFFVIPLVRLVSAFENKILHRKVKIRHQDLEVYQNVFAFFAGSNLLLPVGGGQFGEFLASQFGESAKSDKVANFSEGCQSGDSQSKVANILRRGKSSNIIIEQKQTFFKHWYKL